MIALPEFITGDLYKVTLSQSECLLTPASMVYVLLFGMAP